MDIDDRSDSRKNVVTYDLSDAFYKIVVKERDLERAVNARLKEERDQLQAEVERLTAELAQAAHVREADTAWRDVRIAELDRDAARYRFIRDANRSDPAICFEDLLMYAEHSLDDVIDAAIAQEKRDDQ